MKTSPISPKLSWVVAGASIVLATLLVICFELLTYNATYYRLALPESMSISVLGLNAATLLAVLLLVYSLANRWFAAALGVSLVTLLILGVNVVKLTALGRPILPSDILLLDEVILLFPTLYESFRGTFLLAVIGPVIAFSLVYWSRSWCQLPMTMGYRLAFGGVSLLSLALVFVLAWLYPGSNRAYVAPITFDQKSSYEKNGFFLSSIFQVAAIKRVAAPPGYSRTRIEQIFSDPFFTEPRAHQSSSGITNDEPVNVILILLEAFWDPTLLPVEYSRDPLPFFRQLQAAGATGTVQAPTFGGETVRTEFEILTGLPVSSLPRTANPYSSYVRQPVPSLPAVFAERGYHSVAIHPYYGGYWDRATVFPLLGFERYLDIDAFEDPIYSGPRLVSDHSFARKIIEYTEEDHGSPLFMYAISIATHGPFSYQATADSDLRVLTPLTLPAKHLLENYIRAVSLADQAFRSLTEYFSSVSEKTLIVAFGDHLPILGDNFLVYRESGWLQPGETSDRKMFTAPFMVWANYDLDLPTNVALKSHYMLSFITELAGLDASRVTSFNKFARLTEQSSGGHVDADYEQISYDTLFGEQYILGDQTDRQRNLEKRRDYISDLAKRANVEKPAPRINNWGPSSTPKGRAFNEQPDGSSAFWFKTANASKYTEVKLEDETLISNYDPATRSLSARVNPELIGEPGQYRVRLYDRRSKSSSQEVVFTVQDRPPDAIVPDHQIEDGDSVFPAYIAHAGGLMNGRGYTNSLEALDHNYHRGFRFFELDINWTTDEKLVLIHDWDRTLKDRFDHKPGKLSLEEFESLSDRDGLTQLTVARLAEWVTEHADVSVVTDIKENNLQALKKIADDHPDLQERLVVQIYNDDEYSPVARLGYKRIILTLYRSGYSDNDVLRVSSTRPEMPVTMPIYRTKSGLAQQLRDLGVFVYVHTVNDSCQQLELLHAGVSGFYTASLDPRVAPGSLPLIDPRCQKVAEADSPSNLVPLIQRFGPKQTIAGQAFNVQPNGEAAMWLHLKNVSSKPVLEIGEKVLIPDTVVKDGELTRITTFVPRDLYSRPGRYELRILDRTTGIRSKLESFTVTEQ